MSLIAHFFQANQSYSTYPWEWILAQYGIFIPPATERTSVVT